MSKGIRINKQIATTLTLLGLIVTVGFMLACGPKLTTKKESFPNIYDEKPLSILVLPPINMTTAADAKRILCDNHSRTCFIGRVLHLSYRGYYGHLES